MRQPSKTVTPTQASQTHTLHPVLQSTLANLDIQLEEELARYRRQRAGGRPVPRPMGQRQSAPKPLDLISVSASGSQPSSLQSNPLPSRLTERYSAGVTSATAEAPISEEIHHDRTPMSLAIASPIANEQLAVERTDNELSSLLATMTVSEDRPVISENNSGLEDYLESSEDLIRSLAEEEAQVHAERGFMQSLLTPLGMGSMLLLLLSSAMFGYVIMNPASLNRFFTARNPSIPSPSTAPSENSPAITPPNTSPQAAIPGPQPNLAAQEFKDLNLRTLGTLKPNATATLPGPQISPSSTGSTAPLSTNLGAAGNASVSVPSTSSTETRSPAAAASVSSGAATSQGPSRPDAGAASMSRSAAPAVSQPAPTQSYRPAPAAPAASRANAEDNQYKIVVHYDSDRTLEDAKKAVPDAYVRNFHDGAKIQLGAFSSAADAEARAQELRRQGISAEVYKH